jgi:YHS domain-containing protein
LSLALSAGFAAERSGARPAKGLTSEVAKPKAAAAEVAHAAKAPKGDPYPLATCAVCGMKLDAGGAPIVLNDKGRETRLCSAACEEKFKKGPEPFLKKIDEEIVKQQLPYYPLDTCLVSGKKLGEGKEPFNLVYKNRLIRFCCPNCPAVFEKDPGKYIKQLDAAIIEKQKPGFPLDTCIVSGEKFGGMGAPLDVVQGNRLFRFCCPGCPPQLRKDPAKWTAAFDAALKAKGQENFGKRTAPVQ